MSSVDDGSKFGSCSPKLKSKQGAQQQRQWQWSKRKKEEISLLKRSTRRNEKNVFNFFAFHISLMMMHNACLHAACYSLIKNVFLSPPRALAPLRVHPNHPPNGCFCFVWVELVPCPRGADGEKDKQISKQTAEIQEMKFERKLFCCLLCELWCWRHRFFLSRFMCFCGGKKLSSRPPSDAGESSTLSQLTLRATKEFLIRLIEMLFDLFVLGGFQQVCGY